ncbi:MaoC/PaaZ C-terminal domain-containing protein [Pseudonocardia cypriaca]|uniref:Acyl dehydratase n=1 Tax=Pseudonocardia cypriaca TaxID=882449 RepID=A0A543FT78_9PSEU|nr:MaoC/PaaZ C-terminal domain-containing protein [Pseudonocardia cypriaca]TQM37022.1 acyl dehydratase [Pseudonocardia cypriaca]
MKLGDPAASLVVDRAGELTAHVGNEIGISGWAALEEADVLGFAELTGDRHWIHTDPDRARAEVGLDGLLAHGFLVLSLITALGGQCYTVRRARRWTNYGLERLRFTAPVFPGDEFRLRLTLDDAAPEPAGTTRLDLGCLLERRNHDRPALVATWIVLVEEA